MLEIDINQVISGAAAGERAYAGSCKNATVLSDDLEVGCRAERETAQLRVHGLD